MVALVCKFYQEKSPPLSMFEKVARKGLAAESQSALCADKPWEEIVAAFPGTIKRFRGLYLAAVEQVREKPNVTAQNVEARLDQMTASAQGETTKQEQPQKEQSEFEQAWTKYGCGYSGIGIDHAIAKSIWQACTKKFLEKCTICRRKHGNTFITHIELAEIAAELDAENK